MDMGFFGVNGRNIWELSQRWGLHNTENALNATELVNFRLCKFHFNFFFFFKKGQNGWSQNPGKSERAMLGASVARNGAPSSAAEPSG